MGDSVEANFRELHAAMLDESNETGAVSYGTRAKLALEETFWGEDYEDVIPTEVFDAFLWTFNDELFKTCALKTAHLCDFSWKDRLVEAVQSLDTTSHPDMSDSDPFATWVHDSLGTDLENELSQRDPDDGDESGVMAGFSCHQSLCCHLWGFEFDSDAETEKDVDFGPDDWDSAFFSSIAVAHGAEWVEGKILDNEARTEFWKWYVTEAVPHAFNFAVSCVGLDELD